MLRALPNTSHREIRIIIPQTTDETPITPKASINSQARVIISTTHRVLYRGSLWKDGTTFIPKHTKQLMELGLSKEDALKKTSELAQKIFADSVKFAEIRELHSHDSNRVHLESGESGSFLISTTGNIAIAREFSKSKEIGVIYELKVPVKKAIPNEFNTKSTGLGEEEYLVPEGIDESWVTAMRMVIPPPSKSGEPFIPVYFV